jgi:hypothetical protein
MIVANEYKICVDKVLNSDLPKKLKVNFIHYDMKAKRKQEKQFPNGLFVLAKDALKKIGIFSIESHKD